MLHSITTENTHMTATVDEKNAENDMLKKLREMLDGDESVIVVGGTLSPGDIPATEEAVAPEEAEEPKLPMEIAVERALFSLGEIAIYGSYGRSAECAREAQEAFDIITEIKTKYEEQNRIVDILSGRLPPPQNNSEMDDEENN